MLRITTTGGAVAAIAVLLGMAAAWAGPPAGAAGAALTVSGAYARATPPGATTGAVYLVIANASARSDRLVEARTSAASSVMVHATALEGGVLTMREGVLEVPAHGSATLAPQGSHLMLMDLKAPLVAGTRIAVSLRFLHAGEIRVDVPVRAPNAGP